ncbi:unnamed protein product [Polarella glacialis]|uniref:Uncharacterized protein n=1 Tax=Polarella glacialis TaxID=89957 RepID=A0A813HY13_POLGL|nr:unnamed protein product [Polarella glacialis]CAE8673703.1 unnamed protein product [Polarella glacialis]|mmetsp:Transcript_80369/g.145077  ORF Transcript_80369/g.145077 Transcript_80369/m.145077 type:complete len:285 (-) Transcript_80369:669-1523(-)
MMDLDGDAEPIPVQAWTDSTACLGIAQRLGVGKLRHLAVRHLWVQEVCRARQVELAKIDWEINVADMLTKHLQPARLEMLRRHVGLHAAAGADETQPEQLNMMCEEPLPLCPECHQVCVRCAGAFRARRATAANSGSSTWERVASPPGPATTQAGPRVSTGRRPKAMAKARPAVSTGRRPPADGQVWTTTTSASSTSTTWRPNPRPVARSAAAEGQQTPQRPDKFANLQGQATNSQLDYIGLLSRRLGVSFDAETAAESLSKQEASELIDSLLLSRLPREQTRI